MIMKGSKGEKREEMEKIERDEMRRIEMKEGDKVIYQQREIKGKEKEIIEIKKRMIDRGIKIIGDEEEIVKV